MPLLGSVPWNGALVDPSNPLVLLVDADTDRLGRLCGLPDGERASVATDASRVVVRVSGYAKPFRGVCAGVGHAPTRVRVDLDSPLGTRVLVDDSDGTLHRVETPSSFPSLTPPAGFTPGALAWDDREPELSRVWTASVSGAPTSSMSVAVTPAADVDLHGAPDGPIARRDVSVGPSTATVWHTIDAYNDDTTVRWQVSDGRVAQLRVTTHPGALAFDVDDVIALARTVSTP